jgi:peptidoglycan/xylan/chitin deacetylase (PgdA/CDA1 family)
MTVTSLGAARRRGFNQPRQLVLTFDDGCETDLEIAAELLAARNLGATFFVVSDWIGTRRGFSSASKLRRLAQAGFEIGSHSKTHAFLSQLDDASLMRELVDSKRALEDMLGVPVHHLSCPGGRWNGKVASLAADVGYETVSTSRPGVNTDRDSPLAVKRCPIRSDTSQAAFERLCQGRGLVAAAVQERALGVAKRLLGGRLYGGLRNAALRQP